MMEACGKILPFFCLGGSRKIQYGEYSLTRLGSTGASERWFPPGTSRAPKRLEVGKKMKRT